MRFAGLGVIAILGMMGPSAAAAETSSFMRLFVAGGSAAGSTVSRSLGEFGGQFGRGNGAVARGWSISLAAFDAADDDPLPMLSTEAFMQYRLWQDRSVSVSCSGGAGVSVVFVVPFPALHISTAIELPIQDGFVVDMGFHTRAIFDPYSESEGAVMSTVQLGLSF